MFSTSLSQVLVSKIKKDGRKNGWYDAGAGTVQELENRGEAGWKRTAAELTNSVNNIVARCETTRDKSL